MAFTVCRCDRAHYDRFLRELDTAFQYDPYWFNRHYGHVCPRGEIASDSDIEKNFITLDGQGQVVGALGLYPMDWVVGDGIEHAVIKTAGIGQVSCLPEYRGQGVMSGMIRNALDIMRQDGTQMSWLQGDRFRYGNYGWEYAGSRAVFHFNDARLPKAPVNCEISAAGDADLPLLQSLYTRYPSYIRRDEILWKKHLHRDNLTYMIARNGSKAAYIMYKNDNESDISECQGDPECAHALLKTRMEQNGGKDLRLSSPTDQSSLTRYLYERAAYFTLAPVCQANIIDSRPLFAALLPFAQKQAQACGKTVDWHTLTPDDQNAVCQTLLAFDYLPSLLPHMEFLKPLLFWLPAADDV